MVKRVGLIGLVILMIIGIAFANYCGTFCVQDDDCSSGYDCIDFIDGKMMCVESCINNSDCSNGQICNSKKYCEHNVIYPPEVMNCDCDLDCLINDEYYFRTGDSTISTNNVECVNNMCQIRRGRCIEMGVQRYGCNNDEYCVKGRCVNSACTDTDGFDIETKGQVTGYLGDLNTGDDVLKVYEDGCKEGDDSIVYEFYCGNGRFGVATLSCMGGTCLDGKCINVDPDVSCIKWCTSITSPGKYVLCNDLSIDNEYSKKSCLDIMTDNVTIYGGGYSISSEGLSNMYHDGKEKYAVYVRGRNNIILNDLQISNYKFGINLIDASEIIISGSEITDCKKGIGMSGNINDVDISYNNLTNNEIGLEINQQSTDVMINYNTIMYNENEGIYIGRSLSDYNINNNKIFYNGDEGLDILGLKNSKIWNNEIIGNGIGIEASQAKNNVFSDNIICNNGGYVGNKLISDIYVGTYYNNLNNNRCGNSDTYKSYAGSSVGDIDGSNVCELLCDECYYDLDCELNQICQHGKCNEVECLRGEVIDRICVEYECVDNSDCFTTQYCFENECFDIETGNCGEIIDHQWIDYECCDDNDCYSNLDCVDHECMFKEVSQVDDDSINQSPLSVNDDNLTTQDLINETFDYNYDLDIKLCPLGSILGMFLLINIYIKMY